MVAVAQRHAALFVFGEGLQNSSTPAIASRASRQANLRGVAPVQRVKWRKLFSRRRGKQEDGRTTGTVGVPTTPAIAPPQVGEPADRREPPDRLTDYVEAYRKARLYHGTNPESAKDIAQQGLLTSFGGTGLNDAPYREGRVFLGHDAETSEGYGKGPGLGRVFLPPERTVATHATDAYNRKIKPIPDGQKGEMFRDPENPTAYFTEQDVPARLIHFGSGADLVDGSEKSDGILHTIGRHMKGGPPGIEELRSLHRRALGVGESSRRLSMDAGDLGNATKHLRQWKDL